MNICYDLCTGREGNRSRRRADDGLDEVVEMIDRRDFIRNHFDDDQNAKQDQNPRVGNQIPGWLRVRVSGK